MKIFKLLPCSLILFCFACSLNTNKEEHTGYIIKGKIENLNKKELVLYKLDKNSWKPMDTTKADNSNYFVFKGKVEEQDFYMIGFDKEKSINLILDNGVELDVYANAEDSEKTATVRGSKDNEDLYTFQSYLNDYTEKSSRLSNYLSQLERGNHKDSVLIISKEFEKLNTDHQTFIKSYSDSIMPSMAVFKTLHYLDIYSNLDYLVSLAIRMKQEMPKNKYTATYASEITRMAEEKRREDERELNSPVGIGKQAPEISLNNADGVNFKLSSLKGKYVLIDFWASWCTPCRYESPNLVKAYEKYKNRNFEILSVSLDQNKDAWLRAIKQDHFTWKNISDLKGWQSSIVPTYEIQGIPATFLIDPKGIIIAKNLRGPDLEKKLEEVLNK
jgi:peroxiredoxin